MNGHDAFIAWCGQCPWCLGETRGDCPEPGGQEDTTAHGYPITSLGLQAEAWTPCDHEDD